MRLSHEEFEMALAAMKAPMRKRLKQASAEKSGFIEFDADTGGDVYDALMEYVTLHGFDRDYRLTPQGRALEAIADSIFDQLEE